MDVYSRKIVGWSMDKKMRKQLTIDVLELDIGIENLKAGVIVHTDRGSKFIVKDIKVKFINMVLLQV